jgi:hypothetical protein
VVLARGGAGSSSPTQDGRVGSRQPRAREGRGRACGGIEPSPVCLAHGGPTSRHIEGYRHFARRASRLGVVFGRWTGRRADRPATRRTRPRSLTFPRPSGVRCPRGRTCGLCLGHLPRGKCERQPGITRTYMRGLRAHSQRAGLVLAGLLPSGPSLLSLTDLRSTTSFSTMRVPSSATEFPARGAGS